MIRDQFSKASIVFWLLSLLLPGSRRRAADQPFDNFSHLIKSPQSRGLIFQVLGIVATAALLWVVIAAILSFINAWMVIAMAIVMAAIVFAREWQKRRRDNWIQDGCCAECGYDLRATPEICPECGRDARLDEPTWRRVRRELEARLLANAASSDSTTAQTNPSEQPPSQLPTLPPIRVVTHRPEEDDTPIPLEGD